MIKKILSILLIFVIFISFSNVNVVFGADTADDVISGANDFVNKGEDEFNANNSKEQTDKIANTSDFVYNLLLAIAMIIAMGVGIFIGIKFMMASAEEKAEIKELLWPYVIGCVIVFGAIGIWKLAINIFSSF